MTEECDLAALKARRKVSRSKVTKAIKNAMKYSSTDLSQIKVNELTYKIEGVKKLMEEHDGIQDAIIEQMEVEAKPQAEINGEISTNDTVIKVYEEELEKMEEALVMGDLYFDDVSVQSQAVSWIKDAVVGAISFSSEGKDIMGRLEKDIRRLTPYKTHTYINGQLTKAQELLEQVRVKLYTTPAATPTAVPSAEPARERSLLKSAPPPYQIKPPTFNGDPREFHHFCERFTAIMELHKDYYPDVDKVSILADAMKDNEARRLVLSSSGGGYEASMKQLKEAYGRKSVVYTQLVGDLMKYKGYDLSRASMKLLLDRVRVLSDMERVGGRDINTFFVGLVEREFDLELSTEWSRHLASTDELPTLEKLVEFITPRAYNLPRVHRTPPQVSKPGKQHQYSSAPPPAADAAVKVELKKETKSEASPSRKQCPGCNGNCRKLYMCNKFKDMTNSQQWAVITKHKICSNCLHPSHTLENCSSKYTCRHCGERHNYLLHNHTEEEKKAKSGVTLAAQATTEVPESSQSSELGHGFIYTALVSIQGNNRKLHARAALDSCATHSLISEEAASFLKLKRQPINLTLKGAVAEKQIKQWATVNLTTIIPSEVDMPLGVAIVKDLPSATPPEDATSISKNSMLVGHNLADPYFGGKLDIIIGTNDLPMLWENNERKFSAEKRLTAANTIFGWVVSGSATAPAKTGTSLRVEVTEDNDSQLFQQMYELEKVPEASTHTPEEESAIKQFQETVLQTEDGHYAAKLPEVEAPPPLGNSSKMALSRLINNERRMKKMGKLEQFNAEMFGYVDLEHVEVVAEADKDKGKYFLPVKGVVKESSTSTKVRPVFDASARSSSGHSLNDRLLVGPNLYPLILDIIIQFRSHPIAVNADISEMHREVKLLPEDQAYHYLYIRAPDGSLLTCKMKRLTFGVRPSPFIATSVLRHHASMNESRFPNAAKAITNNFYVDDLLAGTATVEEAAVLREELCTMLDKCGMKLRKWRSNSEELLSTIPEELVEQEDRKELVRDSHIKALGIHWDTAKDKFLITTPTPTQGVVTKRVVARMVASVFDVVGLVSPYLIKGKIILQKAWVEKIAWDDDIPDKLLTDWHDWVGGLEQIKDYQIDRFCGCHDDEPALTLHGFSDASQLAYGAVVYLVCVPESGNVSSHLVCSKARVCPLKQRTIPELELEAAKLLAKLLQHVAKVLSMSESDVIAWTDSSIVIAWLKQAPDKLKTFVRNRVAVIKEVLPHCRWRHTPTEDNPADLCSRGTSAEALINSHLWWEGPHWLKLPSDQWPVLLCNEPHPPQLPGLNATVVAAIGSGVGAPQLDLWCKYSSYTKLVRVLAWVLRFIRAYVHNEKQPPDLVLSHDNVSAANAVLYRVQQLESFPAAFAVAAGKGSLPQSHSLAGMDLELSPNHALIVRGRVDSREMIPLSAKNPLTKLMLRDQHVIHGHPGTSAMISIISHGHYIIGIKRELKKIARSCPVCVRVNAMPMSQRMGKLPKSRTELQPPFHMCGVDFAGPVTLRVGAVRKPVYMKSYLCLFVCMATRAVHIEVVQSLETTDFMAALHRFANRRGMPSEMFSDNGSNFLGTAKEIENIAAMLQKSKQPISIIEAERNLKWHFNAPRAPHFGGLWEAGVKIMKKQISKIIQPHPLRLDELINITTHVEAVLNSRPLVPLEGCETEFGLALTPAHFLIGRPMRAPPTPATSTAKITSLRRWQLVQKLQQELSEAWHGHYLQSLQSRTKWKVRKENIKCGQLVYVKDVTLKDGLHWPLAKVTNVYLGKDKLARTVDLRCKGKEYKRPIHLLIPLELEEQ